MVSVTGERVPSCVILEPMEGDFGVLADLDEIAVGIAHVAAPFPAVIV